MAKGIYLGIDSLSRKVKKMYVGVNGLARKIKKGYVGVNGLARLFFSGGKPAYIGSSNDGTIESWNGISGYYDSPHINGGDNEKYAIFYNCGFYAYDKTLLLSNVPGDKGNDNTNVVSSKEAAYFTGFGSNKAVKVDLNLTVQDLSVTDASGFSRRASGKTKDYAMFIGGYSSYDEKTNLIDAFNRETGVHSSSYFSVVSGGLGEQLALNPGGDEGCVLAIGGSDRSNNLTPYAISVDNNLVVNRLDNLPHAAYWSYGNSGASVGKYGIAPPGLTYDEFTNTGFAYDKNRLLVTFEFPASNVPSGEDRRNQCVKPFGEYVFASPPGTDTAGKAEYVDENLIVNIINEDEWGSGQDDYPLADGIGCVGSYLIAARQKQREEVLMRVYELK